MHRWAIVLALAALLGVAAVATRLAAAPRPSPAAGAGGCPMLRLPPGAPAGQTVLFGHVRSLARKGSTYELRFDPALWLSGETARRAAVEDRAIAPGDSVSNDYYIRDENRRLLTYLVAPGARATVITVPAGRLCTTRVTIAELVQIVRGRNPKRRRLFGPGARLGFWIRAAGDTVRSLDQQYQP